MITFAVPFCRAVPFLHWSLHGMNVHDMCTCIDWAGGLSIGDMVVTDSGHTEAASYVVHTWRRHDSADCPDLGTSL